MIISYNYGYIILKVIHMKIKIYLNISNKLKLKHKEHNNRQNFNICIRNLDTNKER